MPAYPLETPWLRGPVSPRSVTGYKDRPGVGSGAQIADVSAGMMAANGVLAGFGRIVVSEIEAPDMLANLVRSG